VANFDLSFFDTNNNISQKKITNSLNRLPTYHSPNNLTSSTHQSPHKYKLTHKHPIPSTLSAQEDTMGRSYNKLRKGTNPETPPNWTDQQYHKYCREPCLGREGRPNKAQKCDKCLRVKAQMEKLVQNDTSARRQEKLTWGFKGMAADD